MENLSPFEEWCRDNKNFLEVNKISTANAMLIWDSGKASAMHDFVSLIHAGKLVINLD